MSAHDVDELKEMILAVDRKVTIMAKSLVSCQSHCYVDNPTVVEPPPGKWTNFWRSLKQLFA